MKPRRGPRSFPQTYETGNRGQLADVTGNRQSGPLAVVTGPLHKFGPQPWQYRRSAARGPLSGPFRYRVKIRRNPPKIRDFRAAAHVVADAS
jgi:hypothetical protein